MSIFGSIKDAIFGSHAAPSPAAPQPAPAAAIPAAAPAPVAAAPAPAAAKTIDVDATLAALQAKKGGQQLDWQHSIVDLMKLLGLDSSLDNRKELATELGYTGAKDGSAEMNLWLHDKVMERLRTGS